MKNLPKFLKKYFKNEPSGNSLCTFCQKIDLAKQNDREPSTFSLGTWKSLQARAEKHPHCSFCSLVRAFALKYSLWYTEGNASIEWTSMGGFFLSTRGDNLCFLNEDTAKSPLGSARQIQPQIDPALIKKWVGLCEVHHTDTCSPRQGLIRTSEQSTGLKVFRVIDTKGLCIVEATPGVRYVALSYVWGQVVPSIRLLKDNLDQLNQENSLLAIRQALPKTISDAIDLVDSIGERYLWVDSLCLIQDDNGDMLDGIAHMDLVYQCAVFTIIAGHGSDANSGLPGLHPGSRKTDQLIAEVLPGIKMTDTTGVYNALTKGSHIGRAWTMQELVLSYRTLVFTEKCIYFRCRANCWSEDTIYDNFPSVVNNVLHSGFLIEFVSDKEPNPLDSFSFQLARYSVRKLTKQSDTIHAFTGLLSRLASQLNSGLLEGLPTVAFDITLLWWNPRPREPVERSVEFPSWSWAGWIGHKYGFGAHSGTTDEANSFLASKTHVVWYRRDPVELEPKLVWDLESTLRYGELKNDQVGYRPSAENPYGRTPDEALSNLRASPTDEDAQREEYIRQELRRRKYTFLHFFSFIIFIPALKADFGQAPWAEVYQIIGTDGSVCGGLKFDKPQMMIGSPTPYELVLLSKLDQYGGFFDDGVTHDRKIFWVMLIVWQDQARIIAERRGIGFLFHDCLNLMLSPGKIWKEIVLA